VADPEDADSNREGVNPTRFRSGLVRQGVRRRTAPNVPGRQKAGFRAIGGRKLSQNESSRLGVDATPSRADLIRTAFPQVRACFLAGGGCGIRTREGLHPTRFPSCLRRCSLGFSPSAMSAVAGSGTSANGEERGQLRRELRRRQRLATACDEVGTAVRVVNLPPAPTSDV